jgi:hypothetical protein
MFKGSWKTTLLGVGGVLTTIGGVLTAVFDADPATTVNLPIVISTLTVSFGLIFARDNDKASEDVGAK